MRTEEELARATLRILCGLILFMAVVGFAIYGVA